MSFGTTLYTLRKGKNMSQESLARELNTSRQAVSKWENDQGFPEMDKLMMMSSIFSVTVDYLLKGEEAQDDAGKESGYYASRESIEGFLIYQRRTIKSICLGIFLFFMSVTPFLLFPEHSVLSTVAAAFLVVAGIAVILGGCLQENKYKKITSEPLFIDYAYLTELCGRYVPLKKRYVALLIIGIGFALISLMVAILLEDVFLLVNSGYDTISVLFFAVGAVMFVYASAMMWAFDVVTNNNEYSKNIKGSKTPLTTQRFWHIVGIVVLCIAALVFIYFITGEEGRFSHWIEKIISKL